MCGYKNMKNNNLREIENHIYGCEKTIFTVLGGYVFSLFVLGFQTYWKDAIKDSTKVGYQELLSATVEAISISTKPIVFILIFIFSVLIFYVIYTFRNVIHKVDVKTPITVILPIFPLIIANSIFLALILQIIIQYFQYKCVAGEAGVIGIFWLNTLLQFLVIISFIFLKKAKVPSKKIFAYTCLCLSIFFFSVGFYINRHVIRQAFCPAIEYFDNEENGFQSLRRYIGNLRTVKNRIFGVANPSACQEKALVSE